MLEKGKCLRKMGKLEESIQDLKKCCEYPRIQSVIQLASAHNELGNFNIYHVVLI